MESNKFIGSITNKVYNQIRQSSSDAEARRYLKEHQAEQLILSSVDIALTEQTITPEKHTLNKKGRRIRIEKPPFN
jgi:hypothetical protein